MSVSYSGCGRRGAGLQRPRTWPSHWCWRFWDAVCGPV